MKTEIDALVPNMIIVKTSAKNLPNVVANQKHALYGRMKKARPGDVLLLAEICGRGPALVSYAMRLKEQHLDTANEAQAIWGERWPVIVEGEGCRKLDRPFNPQKERVTLISMKNYGPGGTLVYVDPKDAEAFLQKGLLRPLLPPSD